MPDISMCGERDCPIKTDCYRNPASGTKASSYQAYSLFQYVDGKCKDFMPSFRKIKEKTGDRDAKEA